MFPRLSLAAALIAMCSATGASAQTACSAREISQLESVAFSVLDPQLSSVVWLGQDKRAWLRACSRYSDGFVIQARMEAYGTDDANYWIDGRIVTSLGGSVVEYEVTNANGNLIALALIKGVTLIGAAAAACSAAGEC